MRVYALRHGQSEYNILGLCNDDPSVPVCLTPEGRRQAHKAAKSLQEIRFDAAFCSPLPRAVETANIVLQPHSIDPIADDRIADIRSGLEGRPVADYFDATQGDRLHLRINGGESLLDYRERVSGFIGWLAKQGFSSVLVIAHEETLRVFKALSEGLDDEAMESLAFANCEYVVFDR